MTQINFTEKDVPRSLPEDFRKHSIEYLERINESVHSDKPDQSRQKTANEINFIFRLIVDDRMIPVWRKLFEMNPEKTLILFPASISLIYFDLSF